MDKSEVSRAFNKLIIEFLDEVIRIVPDNVNIKKTKLFFESIKSMNPSLMIKLWFSYVYQQYTEQIDNGDASFFIDKEYSNDLVEMKYANEILQGIQQLREPVRSMSEENKAVSMLYVQKLSQLSVLYQ